VIIARRVAASLGLLLLAGAAVLMLWPIHANGVSGNAFRPHYKSYGVEAYSPLPAHPIRADFVSRGISWPPDTVHNRRILAAGTAAGGVVLGLAAVAHRRRRPAMPIAVSLP
jgi:hypothetical protein